MEQKDRKIGFAPIFDEESRILILGSFPSVKSRENQFYYGNKRNRFWGMLSSYFKEKIPKNNEEKKDFLRRRKIALWDIATSCEIEGSSDSSLKNAAIADLSIVLNKANIEKIFLNGARAFQLFSAVYQNVNIPYVKMPSTSPANLRYDEKIWAKELDEVFRIS